MESKKETTSALRTHLTATGRVCREFTTDQRAEFTSAGLQYLMQEEGNNHAFNVALNDLNTIDRAMGVLKDRIGVHAAEAGDTWLDAPQTAADARNSLETRSLLDKTPEGVAKER